MFKVKYLASIAIVIMAAIGLVSSLAWVALKKVSQKNGFDRKMINPELKLLDVLNKNEEVTGISGYTNTHIYFKTKKPGRLLVTRKDLSDGRYINIRMPEDRRIASAFYCTVDSPTVHIMAGNVPLIIQANLNNDSLVKVQKFPTALFTRATVIGPNSYIFRGFDTTERKSGQIFIKGNIETGELKRYKNIVNHSKDIIGLSSDGYLSYDKYTNILSYVSFYSNQILCLDTNMNVIYRTHTIDTTSSLKINTERIKNAVTNTSPIRPVNGISHVDRGKLYVVSKLKADNDLEDNFLNSTSVDVYDLRDGRYMASFSLPFYNREKVIDFQIVDDIVIAIHKNYFIKYELPEFN